MKITALALTAAAMLTAGAATPLAAQEGANVRTWADVETIDRSELPSAVLRAKVIVDDAVTGGCWTNASRAEAELAAGLKRMGVEVDDADILGGGSHYHPYFMLQVKGHRGQNSGLCVGLLDIRVAWEGMENYGVFEPAYKVISFVSIYDWTAYFASPDNFNAVVLDHVQWFLDDFAEARAEHPEGAEIVKRSEEFTELPEWLVKPGQEM